MQRKPDWKGLFVDGLHFSPDGQQAVLELVMKTIDKTLPHLRHGPQLQPAAACDLCRSCCRSHAEVTLPESHIQHVREACFRSERLPPVSLARQHSMALRCGDVMSLVADWDGVCREQTMRTDYPLLEDIDFSNIDQSFSDWAHAEGSLPQPECPTDSTRE